MTAHGLAPRDPAASLRRRVVLRAPLFEDEAAAGPPGLRVGLLGGSFNPAHEGHRYASIEALRRLALDQVWWLVTTQNPLKPAVGMAPFATRLARARDVAAHPRIRVSAIEARFGTRYTVDTLARLRRWRGLRLVWLIGADNLLQLPRWRHWDQLMRLAPVAVIERHPYSYGSLAGAVAHRYQRQRCPESEVQHLVQRAPPAWAFLRLRPHPASSTALRSQTANAGRSGMQEQSP